MAAANFAFGANAHMQDARKSPEWFTRGVMYQIQPRAFTPEGTLKAAAEMVLSFSPSPSVPSTIASFSQPRRGSQMLTQSSVSAIAAV